MKYAYVVLLVFAALLLPRTGLASTSNERIIYTFGSFYPQGVSPHDGLIPDAAGNFYGVASGGPGQGEVFELKHNPDGHWTTVVLYGFKGGPDGSAPVGGLAFDRDGNLYGTTFDGGNCIFFGCGTVFELLPQADGTWKEKILYRFKGGNDGQYPHTGVIMDQAGNLYGTTELGKSGPTVFELTPSGGKWSFKVLHTFSGVGGDGGVPNQLILDATGNLYGTAQTGGNGCTQAPGCGSVFELSPRAGGVWIETLLYEFMGGSDGSQPLGALIFDAAGNLYGTTSDGGGSSYCSSGCGTVFRLSPSSGGQWTEEILYSFQGGADGEVPETNLVFDPAGNLYGTTYAGGVGTCTNSCGTAFELSPGKSGWQKSLLWAFTGGSDGGNPSSGLFLAPSGALYGEAYVGGLDNNGVVYQLSSAGGGQWQESAVTVFPNGTDGSLPESALVFDSSGNAYGTTLTGGKFGFGTAYKLTPGSGGTWQESIVYNFDIPQGRDYYGISSLAIDALGNLYGETYSGGAYGSGIVFELSPSPGEWTKKNLHVFTGGADGRFPEGGLVFDASGYLYGTATTGGTANDGVVFKLAPGSSGAWTQTVIHNFVGYPSDGQRPAGGVVFDQSGNLYGVTQQGGTAGCIATPSCGTVYKLEPHGGLWSETVLHNFAGGDNDGGGPSSHPVFDHAGNLYGSTVEGGDPAYCKYGCGTIYELSPVSAGVWNLSRFYAFPASGASGFSPSGGVVFDPAGNLYGTTTAGGSLGPWCLEGESFCGVVFKLTPESGGGWAESVVHPFGSYRGDGSYPADLVVGPNGNFFGPALGGSAGTGVVFEIKP